MEKELYYIHDPERHQVFCVDKENYKKILKGILEEKDILDIQYEPHKMEEGSSIEYDFTIPGWIYKDEIQEDLDELEKEN